MRTQHSAKFYEKDGVLFFYLIKPSTADIVAVPFELDAPATNSHIEAYPAEYKRFLREKAATLEAQVEALVVERMKHKEEVVEQTLETTDN